MSFEAGGNEYSMCQIELPVKPLTTPTPSFLAALAASIMFWAARCRTPSGLPSPQISGEMMAL